MTAKKAGCLRKVLGVLFTTIVIPVLVNVLTQDAAVWQRVLGLLPEPTPAPTASFRGWDRPVTEEAGTRDRSEVPSVAAAARRRHFVGK
jgi:hypothetical protein